MTLHDSDTEIGRVLGGRYRIVAPIGVGASARVYLADDITLRRRVAVKVLHDALAADDGFLRRFRAEAQSAASLNHPHVLGVYDWGHDEVPFLVSEYLGGGSLQSMFDGGHRLTPSQGLLVGLEAARGLEYAHGKGLVHRDIKPANLLFDDSGRLRIADFGLARALAEAGWTEPDGSMVGTARYAAPEQARGERVGPAADVYALALVINEAVSGELPFAADTAIATLMARIDTPLEPHSDLGPLGATLRRAGALDPTERPTASEFVRGFMEAAEDLPRPAPLPLVGPSIAEHGGEHTQLVPPAGATSSPPTPLPVLTLPDDDDEPIRRWPWLVLALVALLAAGIGGAVAYQNSRAVTHTVPELVGGTEEEAIAAAREFGWVLDTIQERRNGTEPGEVLAVVPAEGTELEEGEILEITVSLGEELVLVPELANQTVEEAQGALEAVGLALGERNEAESETVEAGLVIDVVLDPGVTEVEPGTAVDVIVSEGPAERTVPEVPESLDLAEASQALSDQRLVPEEREDWSTDIAEGLVITYDPSPGAFVPADSIVGVIVSKGPQPVPIPNVVGLDVDEAQRILRAEGFKVGGIDGDPALPVLFTSPRADEIHRPGTSVEIVTQDPR